MTKQEVIALMKSSTNDRAWDNNCDKVKAAHNGEYPDYWFKEIVLYGIIDEYPSEGE